MKAKKTERTAGAALIAAALFCAVLPCAQAHAVLMQATPAADKQLDKSPVELALQFSENVGPVYFKVLDNTGREAGAPRPIRTDGNSIFLPLGTRLATGTYVVSYRVISADTHPVGGSYAFSIGEPLARAIVTESAASSWVIPSVLNRVILYTAVLLSAGSALLLLLVPWPATLQASVRRQGRVAAMAAAFAFVGALAFGGADIVDAGKGALFAAATWHAALASTFATSALIGIPGAALALWAFSQTKAWPLWSALLLLLVSFLVTGHAATAAPVWFAAANIGLHLAGAGFWFAAFWPMIGATKTMPQEAVGRVMGQFSTRALWFVLLVLASGVAVSWIQLRSIAGLFSTDYGYRLIVKIALVLLVLAMAAFNKFKLTPALDRDTTGAAARMARSIRFESAVMLLIVVAAASLTLVTPPRALARQSAGSVAQQAATGGYKQTWTQGGYSVEIEVTPAKAGDNMIMLRFKNAAGAYVPMKSASVDAALPIASIDGINKEGQFMAPDMFHVMISEMVIAGEWKLTVNGFIDDFDKVAIEGTVPIK